MADAGLFLEADGGGPGATAFAVRRLRTQFAHLADLCDLAPAPSRRLDRQIAALLSARLASSVRSASSARVPRYTSLPLSALTILPAGCWVEHREGPGPSILIFGSARPEPIAGARSLEPALAICAAALRARANAGPPTAQSMYRQAQRGEPA